MNLFFDYEQMNDILEKLNKKVIKKEEPIGYTTFGFPIDHYTYGHGNDHVILTAGTHAVELISNVFLIKFMEKLSKEKFIDESKYTLHFIPFVNPEGTIVVTNAIRSVIPKNDNPEHEQLICLQYYLNSKLEDDYVRDFQDRDIKTHQHMFRHFDIDKIDDKYKQLMNNVLKILKEQDLSVGALINWASNGNGIDLNSNIEYGVALEEIKEALKEGKKIYNSKMTRINTLDKTKPGVLGCPTVSFPVKIEPENVALFDFYKNIKEKYDLVGSLIYHSCGDIVYYQDTMVEENPWNKEFGEKDIGVNRKVAAKYAAIANYQVGTPTTYTTMDAKLKSIVPGTLLVELGGIRSTPLSQFLNFSTFNIYPKIMRKNTEAIVETIKVMSSQYHKDDLEDFNYMVLVNKDNPIKEVDMPIDLIMVGRNNSDGEPIKLEKEAAIWFKLMQKEANQIFTNRIIADSGYRTIEKQQEILDFYLKPEERGEEAYNMVALPGLSEHHTGLAIDVALIQNGKYNDDLTGEEEELQWLAKNSYKYGFVLRYPKDKESVTGYSYEPWHFRYVGRELAKKIVDENLTLEEYYNLNVKKMIK